MTFQETIIDAIRHQVKEVFTYARQVPADKLEWKPLDQGRSVLDQLQEVAQSPDYVVGIIRGQAEEPSPARMEAMMAERHAWTTIDLCEKAADDHFETFYEAVRNCSDEHLKDTVWLPYDGGRDFTIKEICEYPRWNANYHAGQIAYIQTLYGDKEMR